MNLIIPDWIDAPSHVGALVTTRQGGVSQSPYDDGSGGSGLNLGAHVGDALSDVERNRALLLPFVPTAPIWMTQVHGINVVDAAAVESGVEADAAISTQSGVVCVVQTADCLPVLFCDVDGRVVGAAHAGWRGLVGGVLESTVARMRDAGAGEIMAWLGPAIGSQQFEVGTDVLTAFMAAARARQASEDILQQTESAFVPIAARSGKYLADIYSLARIALQEAGVQRVYGGGFCTVSDQRFYSFRRQQVTGRMASLIWLK
ncbi:peptidoglycan editing factor PgeF [Glaciimonas sp. PCH181]|uniref:peptidoglycan editing factor PgeF n=1 Tax=Glaciimonas sp. PCH181 TaxID=2133943 RepID=UPI000D3C8F70|nr:peptidoglycan editing factor PgeF [Glaciimonas sp. PCH181]PUA18539.1 peptidoglycan editing factor PgeF [Glaciimonas sp. PCH181]